MKTFAITTLAALALTLSALPTQASDDADADYQALLTAHKAKKYDEALSLAEAFTKEHPDYKFSSGALYMGGNAGLLAKEYERAEPLFRKLIASFPEYKKTDEARDELVSVLRDWRRLEACMAQCDDNLKALPKDPMAERWIFVRAESLLRLWRFAEAKKALEAFLKDYPNSSWVKNAQACLADIDPPWKIDARGVVDNYEGKYKGDARLKAAQDKLPEYTKEAFLVLKQTLGVDLAGKCDVVYIFKDKGGSRDGERASTKTIGKNNKPFVVMTFYTEFVVLNEPDFHSRVIHELKHAGFRGIMGQKYLDVPKWIREGLAVYGARQLQDRLPQILSNEVFGGREPAKVLDGIDERDKDHNTIDYMEDALFFEWLDKSVKGGVASFCQRLVKGDDYKVIIAELCKKKYEDAIKEASAHCKKRVDEALGPAHKEFAALYEEDKSAASKGTDEARKWHETKGQSAWRAWLKKNEKHLDAPLAQYRIGRGLIYCGKYEEARKELAFVRDNFDRVTTICDDAAYYHAQTYELAGDKESAEREFGAFLRDYSWTAYAKEVAAKYKPTGPVSPPAEEDGAE